MHLEILSDKQSQLIPLISRFNRSFGLVGGKERNSLGESLMQNFLGSNWQFLTMLATKSR